MPSEVSMFSLEITPQAGYKLNTQYILDRSIQRNKGLCTSVEKGMESVLSKSNVMTENLGKHYPILTSSIQSTDVCYILAVLYDCLYEIARIVDSDKGDTVCVLPEKIEYEDVKNLRNEIGTRYTAIKGFVVKDILPLLDFIDAVATDSGVLSVSDCICLNCLFELANNDIVVTADDTNKDKVILGRHYLLSVKEMKHDKKSVKKEKAVKAEESECKRASFAEGKERNEVTSFTEGKEPEIQTEAAGQNEKKETEVEVRKTAVTQMINDIYVKFHCIDRILKTKSEIQNTVNMNMCRNAPMSDENKEIMEDILCAIQTAVDTRLQPLNNDIHDNFSDIETLIAGLDNEILSIKNRFNILKADFN